MQRNAAQREAPAYVRLAAAATAAALLGAAKPAPQRAGGGRDLESRQREPLTPLPPTVSSFRITHPKLPSNQLYQLPTAVLALAAAIESILSLGRKPQDHSLTFLLRLL